MLKEKKLMVSPYRISGAVYPRLAKEVVLDTNPYGWEYNTHDYEGAVDFISKFNSAFIGRSQEVKKRLDELIHQVCNGAGQLSTMGFCVNRVGKTKKITIRVNANLGIPNMTTTNYVYPNKIIYKARL